MDVFRTAEHPAHPRMWLPRMTTFGLPAPILILVASVAFPSVVLFICLSCTDTSQQWQAIKKHFLLEIKHCQTDSDSVFG